MKLLSVNTGMPREVSWHGRIVTTAIFKEPVKGRVALRKLNLDGDRQADLTVHGGEHKAVYCYPLAHYDYWKKEFIAQKTRDGAEVPGRELPMGMFGENFTIDDGGPGHPGGQAIHGGQGLLEDTVHLGDRFSVGTAEVAVTQPRLPCYKLGIRFGSDDMVKRFLASGRTGFYVMVVREGEVGAGDEMKVMAREPNAVAGFGDHPSLCREEVCRGGDRRSAARAASERIAGKLEGIFQGAVAAGGRGRVEKRN